MSTIQPFNLAEKFSRIAQPWQPGIVGRVNSCLIKLAKMQGEFIWHHHAHEDELFLVIKGTMIMRWRDGEARVHEGEGIIIPAGVEHCPAALSDEVHVLLVEPDTTLNTGTTRNERTVDTLASL